MKRHRHQEFIRFLNVIDAKVPRRKAVHIIVDNYAAHKHPKALEWIDKHPRFVFHFTPTSASWLNAVESFFAKLTKKRLKRGVAPFNACLIHVMFWLSEAKLRLLVAIRMA